MDLISAGAKTEAFQPCNLCKVRVEDHVKKALIGRALLYTTYRIDPGIGEIAELQIVPEIVEALFELGKHGNARGNRGRQLWRQRHIFRRRRIASRFLRLRQMARKRGAPGSNKQTKRKPPPHVCLPRDHASGSGHLVCSSLDLRG